MRFTQDQLLRAAQESKASVIQAMIGLSQHADATGQVKASVDEIRATSGLTLQAWHRAARRLEHLGLIIRGPREIGEPINCTIVSGGQEVAQ